MSVDAKVIDAGSKAIRMATEPSTLVGLIALLNMGALVLVLTWVRTDAQQAHAAFLRALSDNTAAINGLARDVHDHEQAALRRR